MRLVDIHQELTLLGVSPEVHRLVDDLHLDFGCPPQWWIDQCKRGTFSILKFEKNVYEPRICHEEFQGRLF